MPFSEAPRKRCIYPNQLTPIQSNPMLKGINPLLSADVLHLLASMGHGDDVAVVDANHPAEAIARSTTSGKLIRLPGVGMGEFITALLTVFPLDGYVPDPVRCMEPVPGDDPHPDVQTEIASVLEQSSETAPLTPVERFAFYEAGKNAFGVIQLGDARPYGCFLFRKGVLSPD